MVRMLVVLIVLLVRIIVAQNPSPCPEVFTYEPGTEENQWSGRILVQTPEDLDGVWVKVGLDRPAELLGSYFGEVTTKDNLEFAIKNPKYRLEAGPPVTVHFFIQYDPESTIPSVSYIKLNGKKICTSEKDQVTPPTLHTSPLKSKKNQTSTRQGTSISTLNNPPTPKNQENPTNFFPGDLNALRPSPEPQECGTVAAKANALVSHGQNTTQGQWPWHTAIFDSSKTELIYLCGGTLVSDRHVVTAAHCVTRQHTNQKVDLEDRLVYLGKYTLKRFGTGVQEKELKNIFVHPKFSHTNYCSDIAVLKLESAVEFTRYVRPCCLWEGDTDVRILEEKLGTVVGWGFDENREISDYLNQVQMPIISVSKCLYSNRDFFSQFTSETTFCAGFTNGTSVCNGDSGSGMVFPRTGGQTTIWQLRGIVSVAAAFHGQAVCDLTQYVVFQDVAKHLDWLKKVM